MPQMQLCMGDEGEPTKGLSQVQDQIGCEEDEKGLNGYSGPRSTSLIEKGGFEGLGCPRIFCPGNWRPLSEAKAVP